MRKLALLLCCLLAGCGFHLRGKAPLPSTLKSMSLVGLEKSTFRRQLESTLQTHQIHVSQKAPIQVQLLTLTKKKQNLTPGSNHNIPATLLVLTLKYQLYDAAKKPLGETETLTLLLDKSVDNAQNLLESTEEEKDNQQLIQQFLLKLTSEKTQAIIAPSLHQKNGSAR